MTEEKILQQPKEEIPNSLGEAVKIGWDSGTEFNRLVKQRRHNIVERLKAIRYERRLSQSQVSKGTGINRLTYSSYEREKAEPNAEVLVRLADFYDVSVDYLTCRTDNPKGVYAEQSDLQPAEIRTQTDIERERRIESLEKEMANMKKMFGDISK